VYRWVEHTAETELAIEADSAENVLSEALDALGELLEAEERVPSPAGPEQRSVTVSARDGAGLFAAWLEELVFLAESEGFVARSLVSCRLSQEMLETVVAGAVAAPRPVVKAVTYHRLAFEPRGDGYVANVVLDV
jgi:SHS2 domain-containing protein